ncbi:putative RNA recognition motif domain, nucleotide-binding alpha-beta plait domain superfamily [Helianthus annuus]|nr:putative RNA recognition motif domain, nucleotide-binding alpha-beta plait domain superfamily [Helianthus annuus]
MKKTGLVNNRNRFLKKKPICTPLGAPTAAYDYPSSVSGRGESARGTGKKIFIGRIPKEASVEDLRLYFGRFGRILDVYIPKVI